MDGDEMTLLGWEVESGGFGKAKDVMNYIETQCDAKIHDAGRLQPVEPNEGRSAGENAGICKTAIQSDQSPARFIRSSNTRVSLASATLNS